MRHQVAARPTAPGWSARAAWWRSGTGLSRITGLFRTIITAIVLGTVGVGAAYNLANNTPNMIYDLLLGGVLSATLVPVLVANRERGDDEGTDAVLTVATVFLVVITVVAVLVAPLIVHLYGLIAHAGSTPPSADEEQLATLLLRLFAPQVLFYGLVTLGSALLNSHRRFAAAAFAPVVNNVMLIFVLLAAWRVMGHDTSVARIESDTGSCCCWGWARPPASPRWPWCCGRPSPGPTSRCAGASTCATPPCARSPACRVGPSATSSPTRSPCS